MAILVLPSALNVPQSNPTQTLEFAPIPPEDDQPPPPEAANLESLGLGSSTSAPAAAADGGTGPGVTAPPPPLGLGDRPVTKRCIGSPPRQTEDPLAPPCVAHFDGENGGTTYQGVTTERITVLVYADAKIFGQTEAGADDESNTWKGRCRDIYLEPPDDEETITFRAMRRFQRYFNDRYQTYNRVVGFVLCFSPETAANTTAETRLANAAEHYAAYRPFAVITSGLVDGFQDEYIAYMADKDVMVFGSSQGSRPADFFRRFEGLVWTGPPTVERMADRYIAYLCQKVIPQPVSSSGNAELNGQPRVLGMTHTTDFRWPSLHLIAARVVAGVRDCGGTIKETVTFPQANAQYQSVHSGEYALPNMTKLQAAGVTTVVWPGGFENEQTTAAAQLGYYPEWIVLGTGHHEGNNNARIQNGDVWEHAWLVTTRARQWPRDEDPCRAALREVDPSISNTGMIDGCDRLTYYYDDLLQLFTGIQVAGPNLTPQTVDRGFHAIPARPSQSPFSPSCFYDPGDYTCVKDAMVETWDADGQSTVDSQPGCWRPIEGGLRYSGVWPPGNIEEQITPSDPCNTDVSTSAMFAPVSG